MFLYLSSNRPETEKSVAQEINFKSENPTDKYVLLDKNLIAEHNKIDDCWLYIDDSVYVVTSFIQSHSGGQEKILPFCGGDATTAFKSRIHSAGAKLLLKRLNIGKIDQQVLVDEVEKVKNDDLLSP